MTTIMDWNKRKQQVLDYIRANSGKYNGAEIEDKLEIFSINELKQIKGRYISYLGELETEGKIKYDWKDQQWYAVITLDNFISS